MVNKLYKMFGKLLGDSTDTMGYIILTIKGCLVVTCILFFTQ